MRRIIPILSILASGSTLAQTTYVDPGAPHAEGGENSALELMVNNSEFEIKAYLLPNSRDLCFETKSYFQSEFLTSVIDCYSGLTNTDYILRSLPNEALDFGVVTERTSAQNILDGSAQGRTMEIFVSYAEEIQSDLNLTVEFSSKKSNLSILWGDQTKLNQSKEYQLASAGAAAARTVAAGARWVASTPIGRWIGARARQFGGFVKKHVKRALAPVIARAVDAYDCGVAWTTIEHAQRLSQCVTPGRIFRAGKSFLRNFVRELFR